MNKTQHIRWLAGALCAVLAACSTTENTPNQGYTSPSSNTSSNTSNPSSNDSSSSNTASAAGTANTASSNSTAASSTQVSYGSVLAIDSMQRQDIGAGTLGAAAAGGSMGAPTDRVYRVAVRMDDGTTQTVVVDSKPNYQNGDRVRYINGVLEKY